MPELFSKNHFVYSFFYLQHFALNKHQISQRGQRHEFILVTKRVSWNDLLERGLSLLTTKPSAYFKDIASGFLPVYSPVSMKLKQNDPVNHF